MANHQALVCPQCGGALPRQALWKLVACPFCSANITLSQTVVQAADFRAAYLRAQTTPIGAQVLQVGAMRYQILRKLGSGSSADVFLAERLGACRELVVLKLAHPHTAAEYLQREFAQLQALQASTGAGVAYFSTRLPQPVACAQVQGSTQYCLVLRHPTGYWGSLEQVQENYRHGVDARHVVWMWRRILEVLNFLHDLGWSHSNLQLAHALVQPHDHGVQLISFGAAEQRSTDSGAHHSAITRDVMQAAWAMRALLAGGASAGDKPALPHNLAPSLANVFMRASEDAIWCQQRGALGIDRELQMAARAAFGAPRFLHFKVEN